MARNVADIVCAIEYNGQTIQDVDEILVNGAKHLSLLGRNRIQDESHLILEELRLFMRDRKRRLLLILINNRNKAKCDMKMLKDIGLDVIANLMNTVEEKVHAGEKLVQQIDELIKKEDENVSIMSESIG